MRFLFHKLKARLRMAYASWPPPRLGSKPPGESYEVCHHIGRYLPLESPREPKVGRRHEEREGRRSSRGGLADVSVDCARVVQQATINHVHHLVIGR